MRRVLPALLVFVLVAACGDADDAESSVAPSDDPVADETSPGDDEEVSACPTGPEPGVTRATIEAPDGRTRDYAVDVPEQRDLPSPLVVDFYLLGGSVDLQLDLDRWGELAEEEGVVVVYPEATMPEGSPSVWFASPEPSDAPDAVDDVGFAAALIDELIETACIDPDRVHVIGTSLGGNMASVVACHRPDLVASLVTVSGIIPSSETCTGDREPALLQFLYDADPVADFATLREHAERWATERGCEPDAPVEQVTDEVTREDFAGCSADVSVVTASGRGHLRPGDPPGVFDEAQFGNATQDLVAADLAWEWFEAHPRTI